MNEDIQFILDSTKEAMEGAITHLSKRLLTIRAGKASPAMLDVPYLYSLGKNQSLQT